jgi:hypothetical protein
MSNNTNLVKATKPTITSLFKQLDVAIPLEQLNVVLATPPPSAWVKQHPFIKGYNYLPIDKVEYLLRRCFKKYSIEVLKTGMLMNAVEVTVRVHYLNPATNTMEFHDGVGAQELQTKAGSGSLQMDMSNVGKGAVMMALPIAKTIAIKDACDHFGDLFGANLNRKDVIAFTGDAELLSYDKVNDSKERERVLQFIEGCTTLTDLYSVRDAATTLGVLDKFNAKEVQING